MSFEERLAARVDAPRRFKDVSVAFDDDLAEKRALLEQELEVARKNDDTRLAAPNVAEAELQKQLDALIEASADALVTFRFYQLPGAEWAEITARCPVRLDVAIDRQYGYNMQAAVMLAAPKCGVRVDGDVEVPVDEEQWRDLFKVLSGHEVTLITDAIYDLNEWSPAQRVNALKKVLALKANSEQS